jgi:hypothetical protein
MESRDDTRASRRSTAPINASAKATSRQSPNPIAWIAVGLGGVLPVSYFLRWHKVYSLSNDWGMALLWHGGHHAPPSHVDDLRIAMTGTPTFCNGWTHDDYRYVFVGTFILLAGSIVALRKPQTWVFALSTGAGLLALFGSLTMLIFPHSFDHTVTLLNEYVFGYTLTTATLLAFVRLLASIATSLSRWWQLRLTQKRAPHELK